MPEPTTVDEQTRPVTAAGIRDRAAAGPVVVEVRDVHKTFHIPERKVDSLKERITHPFTRIDHRELHALRGISFDVHRGEFFGIVGRNGSGKSSLLKILASIYRPDQGRVRTAGLVAPFIELGVGFNPELTARENGVLNGVLMGLTLGEARRRLDAVLDFAELRDFVDLKLKNYSSGMMVRLAFAVMVQADADIMLIDEVLAVGDAAFSQKCMDVFHERRRVGKTVVLVTHDMGTVQSLCHRAVLIHDGEIRHIGAPEDTAMEYYRLNFSGPTAEGEEHAPPADAYQRDVNARVVRARLVDEAGETTESLEQGRPIVLDAVVEAARDLTEPMFGLMLMNEEGVAVTGRTWTLDDPVPAGRRVRLQGELENPLVPGRYYLDCWVRRDRADGALGVQAIRMLNFLVYGTAQRLGLVSLNTDVRPEVEAGDA
jgi:ABC-2 type transport system ATP-binding protein